MQRYPKGPKFMSNCDYSTYIYTFLILLLSFTYNSILVAYDCEVYGGLTKVHIKWLPLPCLLQVSIPNSLIIVKSK